MKNTFIIGSGVSGLSSAFLLKEEGETCLTVLEKDNRIGGRAQTFTPNKSIVEVGTQYLAETDVETIKLLRKIDDSIIFPEKQIQFSYIHKGKKYSAPTELLQNISPVEKKQINQFFHNLYKADMGDLILQQKLFNEWYVENTGKESLWFFEGIIRATTTESTQISAWNGINLLQAMLSKQYSVKGGMVRAMEKIKDQLPYRTVQKNRCVTKFEVDADNVVEIILENGSSVSNTQQIISTLNANQLRQITPVKEYNILDKVKYTSSAYIYLQTKTPILDAHENIAFADTTNPVVSVVNRSTSKINQYGFLVMNPTWMKESDERMYQKTIANVAEFIDIKESEILAHRIFRWENSLPILSPELHQIQSQLDDLPLKNLIIAGDFTTFPSIEGAVISAQKAVRKIH